MAGRNIRVGVYAQVPEFYRTGGQRAQYDVLRKFAVRDEAEAVRLQAYTVYDYERAGRDNAYQHGASAFLAKIRAYGMNVTTMPDRPAREDGYRAPGLEMQMAVDCLTQANRLDRVLLATGDAQFVPVIKALQAAGVRVEVVGLDDTSVAIRETADMYFSGYLIPGFIPMPNRQAGEPLWGEVDSTVRGYAYWSEKQRGYGYFRFLQDISPNLWIMDARHEKSPYGTCYFRHSDLPRGIDVDRLPSQGHIFEFMLAESSQEGFAAREIRLVCDLPERESPGPLVR